MFKSFASIGSSSVVLGLASIGAAAPASAGMPVIDAANLAQAIQEVLSWGQQLQGMTQQYRARRLPATAEHLQFVDGPSRHAESVVRPDRDAQLPAGQLFPDDGRDQWHQHHLSRRYQVRCRRTFKRTRS